MNPFRRNQSSESKLEKAVTAIKVPTVESRLAALAVEQERWEGFFEGTTISTDVIVAGLKGVNDRRQALLDSQAQHVE